MNIPNILTLGRFGLVPVLILAIVNGSHMAAFLIFVVAGLTDAIDGFIAKRFDMQTELGAYLDPLADKALLISIFITLAIERAIPVWVTILVVSRDIMIMGAVLVSWMVSRPVPIEPLRISKANTAIQIAAAAMVLCGLAFGFGSPVFTQWLSYLVAALTLASMAAYLAVWLRHMAT